MQIKTEVEHQIKLVLEITFMKQIFRLSHCLAIDPGATPTVDRAETKAEFKRYLVEAIVEFDDWTDRQGYNDIIIRETSGHNSGCVSPLFFLPPDKEVRKLCGSCSESGDWEPLVDYIVKHERSLSKGWKPNQCTRN